MNNTYTNDYDQLRHEYKLACEWLTGILNINYKSNRFGVYENDLLLFSNPDNIHTPHQNIIFERFNDFLNATIEAHHLISIHNSFKNQCNGDLLKRLSRVIESLPKPNFIESKNTDNGRNYSFELTTAARFSELGYKINLNTETDVVVDLAQYKLLIECKRITSKNKVLKRIKDARVQIDKRIGNTPSNKLGLIAVDVTYILNENLKSYNCKNKEHFEYIIEQALIDFIKENESSYARSIKKHILGILFEYNAVGFSSSIGQPEIFSGRTAKLYANPTPNRHKRIIEQLIINRH